MYENGDCRKCQQFTLYAVYDLNFFFHFKTKTLSSYVHVYTPPPLAVISCVHVSKFKKSKLSSNIRHGYEVQDC